MNAEVEILNLKDGECWIWPESDYGKAEIWKKNDAYLLFEIPMYGGEPRFVKAYRGRGYVGELVANVESWT